MSRQPGRVATFAARRLTKYTPSCVNPDHLFLGTAADNAEDKRRKGRCGDCSGENNGRAKGKRRLATLASADGAK